MSMNMKLQFSLHPQILIRKIKIWQLKWISVVRFYNSSMSDQLVVVLHKICPFAHRAWLTLLEKQLPFQVREVDLIKKQAWFTQTYHKAYAHDKSSDGKVPILIHGDKVLTESDLISWYVAQSFSTGAQLIPKDSFERLKMRRFIQEVPGKIIAAFYSTMKLNSKTEAEKQAVLKKIHDNFAIIESEIVGPYVLGESYSLADILLYPWLERWCVNEHYFGIKIPEQLVKINGLIAAMQARPAVQKILSQVSPQFYIDGYSEYMK